MAKYCILLALLFVGGFALPAQQDDGPGYEEDMSIFFDHTITDANGRIVGGTVASEGEFPWMVAMINGIFRSFMCGGSVITQRHVLTAAHCIAAASSGTSLSSTLRVTVGTNRWNSGGQTYNLQGFNNHAQYNPNTIKNDIGILITSANILMNSRVSTIPLSSNFIPGGVPARVSGWGRIRAGGAISNQLLMLRVNTVDGPRCVTEVAAKSQQLNIRAPAVDPVVELCTFIAVNQGACNGDSGSALVLDSNLQIGIVSWGLPCARGAPDMFVRVSAFTSWIRGITG